MVRRGTTVVAWAIGLGALAAQAVVVPVATAVARDLSKPSVEVTLPAVEVTSPARPAAAETEPAARPEPAKLDEATIAMVVALGD